MRFDFTVNGEQVEPAPIDTAKVFKAMIKAIEIVVEDSEDYSEGTARKLFFSLSNDERILFQDILKSASPAGTRKSYYSCFKDHMRLENERNK